VTASRSFHVKHAYESGARHLMQIRKKKRKGEREKEEEKIW
jgi:hypothetical protein